MIHVLSQTEAQRRRLHPGLVQNLSPYLNSAHVLAPPRQWIESLLRGAYSWHFFRLRYKNLLRMRFNADPERFFTLLDASQGERPLYLVCHCLSGPCHGDVAADFLDKLREQRPYCNRHVLRPATLDTRLQMAPAVLTALVAGG